MQKRDSCSTRHSPHHLTTFFRRNTLGTICPIRALAQARLLDQTANSNRGRDAPQEQGKPRCWKNTGARKRSVTWTGKNSGAAVSLLLVAALGLLDL